jgi:hypothetical protein
MFGQNGHISILPLLVLLFALMFLFEALGYVSSATVAVTWPIIVGVGAIIKMIGGR